MNLSNYNCCMKIKFVIVRSLAVEINSPLFSNEDAKPGAKPVFLIKPQRMNHQSKSTVGKSYE
jgi:hypothetical protein